MRTVLLFSLLLLFGTSISAQSLRDSISLKIVSFEDPRNVGHYTHMRVAIENHTKEFRYVLLPRFTVIGDCWKFTFEVEYKDGTHFETSTCGVFEIQDMKKTFLLPGERRVSMLPLFLSPMDEANIAVFLSTPDFRQADIARLRFFSSDAVVRESSDNPDDLKFLIVYRRGVISSDWYDLTTPDFDFLRK